MRNRIGKASAGLACLLAALGLSGPVSAEGLVEIYQLAQARDAVYESARHRLGAVYTLNQQARGVLLPSIDLNGGANRNWLEVDSDPVFLPGPPGSPPSSIDQSGQVNNATGWNYGVQLRQPLFVAEAIFRYGQAKRQIALAEMEYAIARQDLILRTASGYFQVLQADQALAAGKAELRALEQELARARKSFEVGTVAITDVNEAQARHDLVSAQVLQYENDLAVARQQLARIIGQDVPPLRGPRADFPLTPAEPAVQSEWTERARRSNLFRVASELGVEVAHAEVRARQGARLPTVFLVGDYNVQESRQPSFGGDITRTETESSVVGVQLSVPLFRGGLLNAQVKEAAALYSQRKSDLVDATRGAELQASQSFLQLNTSIAQARAFEQAVKSSVIAYESARRGREVGVRTAVDVLFALQQVYVAQQNLNDARLAYLLSRLNLQSAVGGLEPADLETIDAYLSEAEAQAVPVELR
ncbi:MAG TPA: TolC family outer membrane protein [Candidatus Macondimonas sp.]|nr:TolC family outer membrane protein [Candidatus Macondimonas sp.]